ncbi:MAG: DedA family protein [Cyanosarcina radialis HA8281-LM2]|jgi:membrane protein DedA with SNARE-associated domain|nr:DedA family protein [Cyanosarcina radialis HA8281-LM2]
MLDWITNTVASLGYVGIALLMLLENLFPPIPSELIMPLAGFAVRQSQLTWPLVILAGTIGSVLGTLPWYYVGKLVGEKRLRRWINRHGKWLSLSDSDIDRSKSWFRKYGGAVVLFGRLLPAIRTYISVPAGFQEMSLLPFLLYSIVGTLLWVGLLGYTGFILGQNYQLVKQFLGPISLIVLVVILGAFGIWFVRRRRKTRRRHRH